MSTNVLDNISQEELSASMVDPPTIEEAKKLAEQEEAEEVTPSPIPEVVAGLQPALLPLIVEKGIKMVTIDGVEYHEAEVAAALKTAKATENLRLTLPKDQPSALGKMLVADCQVKINILGSTVPKTKVTPAEVMLLAAEHHIEAGGYPILGLKITGEVDRTPVQEVRRLRNHYGNAKTKAVFPGAIPQMPSTFAEAIMVGSETDIPRNALLDYDVKALRGE